MKNKLRAIFSLVFTMIFALQSGFVFSASAMEKQIFVSPLGDDSASGEKGEPLKTLNAVMAKLNETNGNAKVTLAGGEYELDAPLDFNGMQNITFEAAEGETVSVSGAHKVTGWVETEINGVKAFSADANGCNITALFKNDKKLVSARLPESGFFYVKSTNDEDNFWTAETTPNPQVLGSHSFNGSTADITYAPSNLKDISACIVHLWQEELSAVTAVDTKSGKVSLQKYASHTIEVGDRYFLDNVFEETDKPLEWCFDSVRNKIFYIPESGETTENIEIFASSNTKLVNIENSSGVSFKNIAFKNTGWEYANEKYFTISDHLHGYGIDIDVSQAGIDVCAALTAIRSKDISFENCEFLNLGCTAVKFMDEVENATVENCWFDSIGASAVFAGGQNNEAGCAKNITVKNCNMGNYGQKFYRAPGVIFTYVSGGEIKNNEIHDGNYTGISCGWIWLYGDHITGNINIENNLIYNIGLGMLSDMGGIYMLGIQKGTKLHGNVIHDVLCYEGSSGYAGTGLYTDAGSSEMELYNNLVFNCSTAGFNATIGRNNVWYNNISAFCGERLVNPPQNFATFISGANYHHNILLTDKSVPVFISLENSELFKDANNLLWDMTYGKLVFVSPSSSGSKCITLKKAKRKKLIDESTVAADPLFKDALNYDFTLSENSPAIEMGFVPWDYNNAGTLDGTVIGLSHEGGQTAYNSNVNQCKYIEPSLSFGAKLAKFFFRISQFFKNLFAKIK
ncbi:MAG: right-handed parallel beta-helix repeat-containing protein [Clostridia bacterium]|nr:right-handed parallel beta-helix repeat-containing protein [Clostridia bacterium]